MYQRNVLVVENRDTFTNAIFSLESEWIYTVLRNTQYLIRENSKRLKYLQEQISTIKEMIIAKTLL